MKWKGNVKGSYTVEAALLMGIILSVLMGVLYLGFFLHDRGIVQGAAHEAACAVSLHADDKTNPGSSVAEKLIRNRMLVAKGVSSNVNAGKKTVCAQYTGYIDVPRFVQALFKNGRITVHSEVTLTTRRPSSAIQKIRGVAKIVNRERGGN